MKVFALLYNLGEKRKNIQVILPDEFHTYMPQYDIEIYMYTKYQCATIYFILKGQSEDTISVHVRHPNVSDNLKEGFREIFNILQSKSNIDAELTEPKPNIDDKPIEPANKMNSEYTI